MRYRIHTDVSFLPRLLKVSKGVLVQNELSHTFVYRMNKWLLDLDKIPADKRYSPAEDACPGFKHFKLFVGRDDDEITLLLHS